MQPPQYTSLPDRFWSKVSLNPNGCHEWAAARTKGGYGRFLTGKRATGVTNSYAHRLAYTDRHGTTPEVVRHTCDNPPCVNHSHLVGGTQLENIKDRVIRGRSGRRGKSKGV